MLKCLYSSPISLKSIVYALVLFGYSCSFAGSYDDFFMAIKQDDATRIAALIKRGFDPNTINPAGIPGLILAIREPSLKVISVLLNSPRTNVEVRTQQDESPLMLAALEGMYDLCEQLISKDADVNKPGWTPLHYAATNGHLNVINLLLDQHAYIDAASPNGTTPLMMAAEYSAATTVQLLLEAGADPSIKNGKGLSALDFARRADRQDSVAMIATFIRKLNTKGVW